MNKLFVTVGVPGSGKSTWLETHKEKLNFTIHSSDSIREEFGDVNDQSQNELVFNILHKRVREDLLSGKNVAYDATSLNRKKRISFLNQIQDIPCEKICVILATPIEICRVNNANRERKVPEVVIDRMIRNFEIPCKQEGWNDIQIVWWDWHKDGMKFDFHRDVEEWRNMSHDNPHHENSIGDHMIKAWEYSWKNSNSCSDSLLLDLSAYMHDCGKIRTKAFINSKLEPCDSAHYYEHHNVSAYESLFYLKDLFTEDVKLNDEEILYVSLLINMHMRPFLAYKNSDKSRERDRRLFGDVFMKDLDFLHECDLAAH